MGRSLPRELLGENRVIVDTSFLLPIVGIRLGEDIEEIMELINDFKIYYPYLMIPELVGVIFKIARKKRLDSIPRMALDGLNYILYSGEISLIHPSDKDFEIAYELLRLGSKDIFDSILYATSVRTKLKAVTLDRYFIDFLREKRLSVDNMILLSTLD